jgi:hypothetical protein
MHRVEADLLNNTDFQEKDDKEFVGEVRKQKGENVGRVRRCCFCC